MDTDKLVAFTYPICVDFKGEEKPEYPQKDPRSTGEIDCANSLT